MGTDASVALLLGLGSEHANDCDVEVDLCYSRPCHNGATCLHSESGYTCLCAANFTGKSSLVLLTVLRCQTISAYRCGYSLSASITLLSIYCAIDLLDCFCFTFLNRYGGG